MLSVKIRDFSKPSKASLVYFVSTILTPLLMDAHRHADGQIPFSPHPLISSLTWNGTNICAATV